MFSCQWIQKHCALYFRLCSATFYRQSCVKKSNYPDSPSSASSSDDDFLAKPIKFSTSDANQHRAYDSFMGKSNAPWYQMHIVIASISVFMLYFCVFREENDIDDQLGKTIYEKIPPLREQALVRQIRSGQMSGDDVSELQKEYDEIHRKYK